MTETKWRALVEADCIITGAFGDTEEEAEEYIKKYVKTGHLGPIKIRALEKDE